MPVLMLVATHSEATGRRTGVSKSFVDNVLLTFARITSQLQQQQEEESAFLTVETMETVPDKPSKCVETVLPPSARPALEYSLGTVPTLNLLIA